MSKNKNKNKPAGKVKKSPAMVITGVIIIILGLVLTIVTIVGFIDLNNRKHVYYAPTTDLLSTISREDFVDLVHDYYNSNDNLTTDDKDRQECFALARYYQYALQFKVFSSSGDCIRASKYRSLMNKEIDKMGDLVSYKPSIDEELGIE